MNNKLSLVLCVVVGLAIGFLFLGPMLPEETTAGVTAPPMGPSIAKKPDLLLPDPALSPQQVVDMQMGALSMYAKDRSAIHQVFAFASPANRAVTGPIDRFEQMIKQGSYYPMIANDHWMAGRVVRREDQATVLVTVVDAQDRVSLFRFYLSLQTKPYENCWMTDRVLAITQRGQPKPSEAPIAESI